MKGRRKVEVERSASASYSPSPAKGEVEKAGKKPGHGLGGFDIASEKRDAAKDALDGGKQVSIRGEWAQMAVGIERFYYKNTKTGEKTWDPPSCYAEYLLDAKSSRGKIFVGCIPHTWDEATLVAHFKTFGQITACSLERAPNGGMGAAFVEYVRPEDAQDAIHAMNGYHVAGDKLKVTWGKL